MDAGDAKKGDRLRLRLRVSDAMPGCQTAKVTVSVRTSAGRTVATRTVAAVAVNHPVMVALKLAKSLRHGSYRLVATSTDWAGNQQVRARTALLKVR